MTSHRCDTGYFDRTLCPEPCDTMHSYCTRCGKRQDYCPHDGSNHEDDDFDPFDDGCFRCGYSRYPGSGQHRCIDAGEPPAPAVAPDGPSPVVVDPPEVSGPQNGTQPANRTVVQFPQPVDIVLPEVPLPDWEVALLMEREVARLTEARERTADRLRMLAETAEAHGGRRRKAAARAYRLAADMIEEDQ